MATYTNLASLEGLQVGDVVNYTTTTAFDAKGYKFRVELYGKYVSGKGGLTKFVIDTINLPATILSFNSRGDLIYGTDAGLYYRIAVGGDGGGAGASGVLAGGGAGGNGGGSTGSTGYTVGDSSGGKGGSQTTGYSFGNGQPSQGSYVASGKGGYGWYGGYAGEGGYFDGGGGGGGGSGFIIGVSTSTYPSGYLGNDTNLRNILTQSISEGSLTNGGSTSYTAKMTITIVSKPTGDQSLLKYYDGNQFINTNAKYYNGTEFIDCNVLYYNGNEFVEIGG